METSALVRGKEVREGAPRARPGGRHLRAEPQANMSGAWQVQQVSEDTGPVLGQRGSKVTQLSVLIGPKWTWGPTRGQARLQWSPPRHSPRRECPGPWTGLQPRAGLFVGGAGDVILRSTGRGVKRPRFPAWLLTSSVTSQVTELFVPQFPFLGNEAPNRVVVRTK